MIIFSLLSFTSLEFSSVFILTLSIITCFIITYFCLRLIFNNNHLKSIIITWILFLIGPIFLPFFSSYIYLGQGSPNIYHNPTFIAQKPFSILVFLLTYFYIQKNKPISIKKIIILSFLLLISILIKPNFSITFIPTLFFYIFITSKDRFNIKRYLNVILIIIPSIILLLLQFCFTYKTNINTTSSSIMISYMTVWKHFSPNPYISLFLGILFPFSIIISRFKVIKKKPFFLISIIYFLFSLIQMALFAEKGPRLFAGNFFWSYYMGLFFLYLVTLQEYILWIYKLRKNNILNKLAFFTSSIILVLHLVSGIYYLSRIFTGLSYF